MLMFQNGLLVTFIPEILMVLGYVLCLFTSGFKAESTNIDQISNVVIVSTVEQQKQISSYQVSIHDYQTLEKDTYTYQIPSYFIEKSINNTSVSNYSESDGLSYVDFSRPPPAFIS